MPAIRKPVGTSCLGSGVSSVFIHFFMVLVLNQTPRLLKLPEHQPRPGTAI